MSTCTPLQCDWASAEGWCCLCWTSHKPDAELGFLVWQLREAQLQHFLPEGEENWKESSNRKSHTWESGAHEMPTQGAACCLSRTN